MNATPLRSSFGLDVSAPALDDTPPAQTSLANLFEVTPRSDAQVRAFRAWFPGAFSAWLQENFHSPEVVAAVFGVRYQTALNWWNGSNKPSGDTLMLLAMIYPQAVPWFVAAWSAHRARRAA